MGKQTGFGIVTVLVVLLILGLIGFFAYRAIPAYVDNVAIDRIIDEIQDDTKNHSLSDEQLQELYVRRLRHNGVWDVSPAQSFRFERRGERFYTGYEYEVRRGFLFNIDLILHFQRSPLRG